MMRRSCFIGQRDAPKELLPVLEKSVMKHIEIYGVEEFIVGERGRFASMAAKAVIQAKILYPEIRLVLMRCFHRPDHPDDLPMGFDSILYPCDAARYSVLADIHAHKIMIKHCDHLIAYITQPGKLRNLIYFAHQRSEQGMIHIEDPWGMDWERSACMGRQIDI